MVHQITNIFTEQTYFKQKSVQRRLLYRPCGMSRHKTFKDREENLVDLLQTLKSAVSLLKTKIFA